MCHLLIKFSICDTIFKCIGHNIVVMKSKIKIDKIKINIRCREIKYQDQFKLYSKLSDNGNNTSLLMESKSLNLKYGRQSIIVPDPAVKITAKGETFTIKALNEFGKKILTLFSNSDFFFAYNLLISTDIIKGKVKKEIDKNITSDNIIKMKNVSIVLKTILNKFDSNCSYAALYGAFSYEFSKNFHNLTLIKNSKSNLIKNSESVGDFVFFIPSSVYVFDDIKEKAELLEFSFDSISNSNINGYIITEKLKPISLEQSNSLSIDKSSYLNYNHAKKKLSYDMSEQEYKLKADQVIKDIRNGRAMQCVLSRSITLPLIQHPLLSYTKLRKINPSPYSFFYNFGDNEFLYGASPEMHIVVKKGVIEIRPIAGTISRSNNVLKDASARINLLTDEKEKREHTMLVDLARSELHAICVDDSVYISDLFTIEEYPNLYHLVSGVKGELKSKINAIDAMLITLPAGTLSGAPKLEAMKMIEQYESSPRNFYGGSIGFLSFNGDCNTGITIRSVHVKNNFSIIRAGGGIVSLSNPENELNETKLKMSKTLSVLGVEL